MIRYTPSTTTLKISITLGNDYSQKERDDLKKALAILKSSPKNEAFKTIVKAFIATANMSKRYLSEQHITKLRRLLKDAPSRPIVMALRQQGLLEGTYTKELGAGRQGFIVYYEIDKIVKRLIELQGIGYVKAMRLHKDGQMKHLYVPIDEVMKDRREIREARQRKTDEGIRE